MSNSTTFRKQIWLAQYFGIALAVQWILPCASGDLGPPVRVAVPSPIVPAKSGTPYEANLDIVAGERGSITNVRFEGQGWLFDSTSVPADATLDRGQSLRVQLRGSATDAEQPVTIAFEFNGQTVQRVMRFGEHYYESRQHRGTTRHLPPTTDDPPRDPSSGPSPIPPPGPQPRGERDLRIRARFVITRPDGVVEPVVGLYVEAWDLDDIADDLIGWNVTDTNGYVDFTSHWDPGINEDDNPDIYFYMQADNDWVIVEDGPPFFFDYEWDTPVLVNDFTGTFFDAGTVEMTSDQGPAHILSVGTLSRYRLTELSGIDPIAPVSYLWPYSGTSQYIAVPVPEILLDTGDTFRDTTITHEYMHHFHWSHGNMIPYGNGGGCPDEGHAFWCDDANPPLPIAEGLADWWGDYCYRDFPTRWTGWQPAGLNDFELENIEAANGSCTFCGPPYRANPFMTEGYMAALFRDLEDSAQDDWNGDGFADSLAIGAPGVVYWVTHASSPIDVQTLLLTMPSATSPPLDPCSFYLTAYNIAPEFGATILPNPPPINGGTVTGLARNPHPNGVGDNWPIIRASWSRTLSGGGCASAFCYVWGSQPISPGTTVNTTNTQIDSPPLDVGTWYLSIRARERTTWASEWTYLGPLHVTDCDDNGVVDACQIQSGVVLFPSLCTPGDVNAADCNGNHNPDVCDCRAGISQDCDLDDVPDTCPPGPVSFRFWVGGSGVWIDPSHWNNGAQLGLPGPTDRVCISGSNGDTVQTGDHVSIFSLSCGKILQLRHQLSVAHRALFNASLYVQGGLVTGPGGTITNAQVTMGPSSGTISGIGSFIMNDAFSTIGQGGTFQGDGQIDANGPVYFGHDINGSLTFRGTRVLNLNSATNWMGGRLNILESAVLNNNGTFNSTTDNSLSAGSGGGTINNFGTFAKTGGTGATHVGVPFNNAGTVSSQSGTLNFGATFVQTAGTTRLAGGAIGSSTPLQLNGGAFTGFGTTSARVNNAASTVQPGLQGTGTLTINSATGTVFTQTGGGTLEIELAGTTSGNEYDQLVVTGVTTGTAVALGGTLRVKLINGFVPTVGQQFTVLTHTGSRTGTFGTVETDPPSLGVSVAYNPGAVVVTVTQAPTPCPADITGNGVVDISDLAVLLSHFGTVVGPNPNLGDLDGDGVVTISDLAILLSAFGTVCP